MNAHNSGVDRPPNMNAYSTSYIKMLFVYGTLKKSETRNKVLVEKGCVYLHDDCLRGYLFHKGGFPSYIPEPTGYDVHGEVYSLPEEWFERSKVLEALDGIECVKSNLYWRLPFKTQQGKVCWTYFQCRQKIESNWDIIPEGRWIDWKNTPKMTWLEFLNSHEGCKFPSKPHVRYDNEVLGPVCDPFLKDPAAAGLWTYSEETAPDYGYSTNGGYRNFSKPSVPDIPIAEKPFDHFWLESWDEEQIKCSEGVVDGI